MKYRGNDRPRRQRQSMTRTYLPRAPPPPGARLVTGCRIDRLDMIGAAPRAGRTRRWPTAPGTIRFATCSCAGGRSRHPALLQRSRISRQHRPNARRCIPPSSSPPASRPRLTSVTTCPSIRSRSSPPSCRSVDRPARPASHISAQRPLVGVLRRLSDWRQCAVYYPAITSEGRGRVQAITGFAIRWSSTASPPGPRLLAAGWPGWRSSCLEAGADEIYPSAP